MKNPEFECIYSCGGKTYTLAGTTSEFMDADVSITDAAVKITLHPKTFVKLISAKVKWLHQYNDGDKFFANGYQSWSTSREYACGDFQRGAVEAKGLKFVGQMSGISSDINITGNETTPGCFHSFTYTYIKNNADVLFLGSLSERSGFTFFRADMNNNVLTCEKDVEGVATDKDYELYNVVIFNGSYDDVFDRYFALWNIPEPKIDHLAGYTSWYNYFQNINEKIILRDLRSMDGISEDINIFQVDDGYETFVGDWLDMNPIKFPEGMKYVAEKIHKKGYMAGIWLAPFNAQIKSRTARLHPDWLIKGPNGKPDVSCLGWGGAYTLDMYIPAVRDHIRHFFDVILNDWGYDMVKLDFLYSQCRWPRYNKSRGQLMCEAMEFLRECCGDKLILGCGVPLGAAFGYVDACRISCDVSKNYNGDFYSPLNLNAEIPSAQMAINNSLFRRHLNHRAFLNDPDVFFLRYSNIKFNIKQKLLLGTVNNICGDVLFVSDNMAEYKPNDIIAAKKFFARSGYTVEDLNIVEDGAKYLVKLKDKDGNSRMLWFRLKTGYGNQYRVMDLTETR